MLDSDSGPYVTPDGGALYFSSARDSSNTCSDLLHTRRTAEGGFGDPKPVFTGAGLCESSPVVSPDELTLYYASDVRMPKGLFVDAVMSWRRSRDAAFPPGEPLDVLNMGETSEFPSWVSPDGCRLYFTRNTLSGNARVFVAERTP